MGDAPSRVNPDAWIDVGVLGRPRALGGLVWFRPYALESGAVCAGVTVRVTRVDGTAAEHVVTSVSEGSHGLALGLRGVVGRDAAEALCKATVAVRRRDFPPPGEGEYYHCDLIGAAVVDVDGHPVGEVLRVEPYPSVDALVVRRAEGSEVEIPVTPEAVLSLDVEAGRVVVARDFVEGL